MATYKVLQDIEAEDKLLGPLTLRQFIYAAITVVLGFVIFKIFTSGPWYIALVLVPPMGFFGLLAAPFGHDQSSEVWMLAKVRFVLKPRLRIWDQDGISDLVTITAPKSLNKYYSDGLSQPEVRSRTEALAATVDSRGWAVKDLGYDPFAPPSSDRLTSENTVAQDAPIVDPNSLVDVMDESTNPTAQNFDKLMAAAEESHRQQIAANMQKAVTEAAKPQSKSKTKPKKQEAEAPAPDFWFMKEDKTPTEPGISIFDNPAVIAPGSKQWADNQPAALSEAEQEVIQTARLKAITPLPVLHHINPEPIEEHQTVDKKLELTSIKLPPIITKQQLSSKSYSTPQAASLMTPVTDTIKPAKVNPALAFNDDLNLTTISNVAKHDQESVRVNTTNDEVTIDLHFREAA